MKKLFREYFLVIPLITLSKDELLDRYKKDLRVTTVENTSETIVGPFKITTPEGNTTEKYIINVNAYMTGEDTNVAIWIFNDIAVAADNLGAVLLYRDVDAADYRVYGFARNSPEGKLFLTCFGEPADQEACKRAIAEEDLVVTTNEFELDVDDPEIITDLKEVFALRNNIWTITKAVCDAGTGETTITMQSKFGATTTLTKTVTDYVWRNWRNKSKK